MTQVNLPTRIASSIIRESLAEHVIADETERKVVCTCGVTLRLNWSSTSTIRVHQADASAAALADFTARELATIRGAQYQVTPVAGVAK